MPGLDRTGPMGQGSRTGRGLGKCNPKNQNTDEQFAGNEMNYPFGAGRGPGRGRGRGRRPGRGLGRGFGLKQRFNNGIENDQ